MNDAHAPYIECAIFRDNLIDYQGGPEQQRFRRVKSAVPMIDRRKRVPEMHVPIPAIVRILDLDAEAESANDLCEIAVVRHADRRRQDNLVADDGAGNQQRYPPVSPQR
ncbi:MAG TPA: hypothetical protein VLX58_15445 [Bryobacteraceae bacterium]|nr:hypothetical protein [Bryobacteraceae bacterium]